MRQLWLCVLLLALGLSPAVLQGMASSGCCCATVQPVKQCCCHDQADSPSCGFSCTSDQPQALLVGSALSVPQEKLAAVAWCCEMVGVLLRSPVKCLDTRQQVPGGWVLPRSPPLLATLLNLPPPVVLLS